MGRGRLSPATPAAGAPPAAGKGEEFHLQADVRPAGDQPKAIEELVRGIESGAGDQVLLGVTGSGKTFTMAHVIARLQRPALILAPNKTLAAQLYGEMKSLFPGNAVEYFVSYYDYYQPEAYVPRTGTYIEKDASINEHIDRMRHAATRSLFEREDVVIVASVSCIYGIGPVETYARMVVDLERGAPANRGELLARLVELQYRRNDVSLVRGTFRVRGDTVEMFPAHLEDRAWRVDLFGDEVDRISEFDPLTGEPQRRPRADPHLRQQPLRDAQADADPGGPGDPRGPQGPAPRARGGGEAPRAPAPRGAHPLRHRDDGDERLLRRHRELLPLPHRAQPRRAALRRCSSTCRRTRSSSSTRAMSPSPSSGACTGATSAARARSPSTASGFPPASTTAPSSSRSGAPCARRRCWSPPRPGRGRWSGRPGAFVEQVIRRTGLVDPECEVRPAATQVDDLMGEARGVAERGQRVLVTTLTKRMAENLTEYLEEAGLRVRYLHSDIDTVERIEIIRDLRRGVFDVLVGINLLREGLDIPECALVAILDADKEGFLRSRTSLIQTIGRAARNIDGKVILYADTETDSLKGALAETERRRDRQLAWNREHGIKPESVRKGISDILQSVHDRDRVTVGIAPGVAHRIGHNREAYAAELEGRMLRHAADLEFEEAARLRDEIRELRDDDLGIARQPVPARQRQALAHRRKRKSARRRP